MDIISASNIENHYRLKETIGKKVLASNGEVIGHVSDIAYDMHKILGIYVVGGGQKVLIGRENIGQLNTDSILLKINPVTKLLGKVVFDSNGKKVGKVTKFVRSSTENDFLELWVKRTPFSKHRKIPKLDIEIIGKTIILNKTI